MIRHTFRVATLAGALAAIGGCAASTPTFDAEFGRTAAALRAQQTRDPTASLANRDKSVDGIEGRAAREAINRYFQSFAEPPPPANVFTIGVGGIDGPGGAR